MSKVLGIVYRSIATHLAHKAGFTVTTAKSGAVTLIQRFGGALNLSKGARYLPCKLYLIVNQTTHLQAW